MYLRQGRCNYNKLYDWHQANLSTRHSSLSATPHITPAKEVVMVLVFGEMVIKLPVPF